MKLSLTFFLFFFSVTFFGQCPGPTNPSSYSQPNHTTVNYFQYPDFDFTTTSTTVTVNCSAADRPNRFRLIAPDGGTVSSGWIGWASYNGPWGASLSGPANTSISLTTSCSGCWTLEVEAGNGEPIPAFLSDNFSAFISYSGGTAGSAPGTPSAITGATTICSGTSTTFSTSASGVTSYSWSYSGGGTPPGSGSSTTFSPTSSGTLTVTASNVCGTSTRTKIITINSAPATPGVISGTSPVCSGSSNTYSISPVSGATSYNWSYSGGGTPSGSGTSVTLSPTSNGTLSVTATNACGTSSASTLPISVTAAEDASFTLSSASECQNGTDVTANITGVTGGTFSASAGLSLNTSTGAIDVSTCSPASYVATYTTSGTCPGSSTQNITISPQDNAGYTYPNTIFCQDDTDPTATILGDAGGVFSSTAGLSLNTSTGAIDLSSSTPGSYSVTYTTPAPCTDTYSLPITINTLSTAPVTITPSVTGTVCQGTNLNLAVSGGAAGTAANYVWYTGSCGGTFAGSTATLPVSATTTTTYFVRYEGTCNNTVCISYTLNVIPSTTVAAAGGNQSVCSNIGTVTLAGNTATQGIGIWSQVSGPSAAVIATPMSPTSGVTGLNTAGNYVFEWSIVNAPCATSTSQMTVTVNTSDDAIFSYSGSTYCLTGTDPTPTITGLAGGGFTSTPAGLILNATTGEITLLTSAVNTYDVTYTTVGPCPESMTVQVTITTSPSAGFSYAASPYCEGSGVAAVTFDPGASAGVFSSTAGLVINASTGEIDLYASTAGTYTVDNNIAAGGGCAAATANTSVTITVQDDPSYSYGATSFCENDVNPVPTITGTAGGAFTSAPAGLTINATTGEIDITTSTLGIAFTVTYTTNGTCLDSEDAMITLNSSPTAPTVSTTSTTNTICVGGSIDILASGSGTGVTYNVYDALTGGTLLGTAPLTVTPTIDTDYYVEVTNANSCSQVGGRDLISVTVNPLPSIDAGTDETICPGDDVTLTATGVGTYSWSTTETTPSVLVSPATTTTYTVTLTDANTCTNSDDVLVTVQSIGGSLVAVDDVFNADVATATNSDVLSNDTHSGTTPNVIGGPNSGTAIVETDGTITYTGNAGFEGTDVFTYTICDAFCTSICDTAEVTVTVETKVDISIPGGFSPNGDGIGDLFVILGLDNFPNNSLQIFNRWGSLIYQADPYNNDWDGTSTESGVLVGGKVTTGTYFYILDLGDGSELLRGSIEIKKD